MRDDKAEFLLDSFGGNNASKSLSRVLNRNQHPQTITHQASTHIQTRLHPHKAPHKILRPDPIPSHPSRNFEPTRLAPHTTAEPDW